LFHVLADLRGVAHLDYVIIMLDIYIFLRWGSHKILTRGYF
jgi:hypothetical protein